MEAGALGGDELADGAEDAYEGVFFLGAGVFWMARSWRVRVSERLAVESEMGQNRLAGLDARNVKNQDLTPHTRLRR